MGRQHADKVCTHYGPHLFVLANEYIYLDVLRAIVSAHSAIHQLFKTRRFSRRTIEDEQIRTPHQHEPTTTSRTLLLQGDLDHLFLQSSDH